MELTVVKRNKTYKNRKLAIYHKNKNIAYIIPWSGWYAMSTCIKHEDIRARIRACVMDNLYWLLGRDCDYDEWKATIDQWNTGKHIYGVAIDSISSLFFNDEEMNLALNSYYNK